MKIWGVEMWEHDDMPQLTRPLRMPRGPSRPTPFRHGQRVIVSNDVVFLRAVISDPQCNVNYDEILRRYQFGIQLEIAKQEDFEAFQYDVIHCNRYIVVCHSKGIWRGRVYSTSSRPELLQLIVGEE